MKQVNTYEAKNKLSQLIDLALAGEEVIIARDNKPAVRLVKIQPTEGARKFTEFKGKISDDFDAPLPEFNDYV